MATSATGLSVKDVLYRYVWPLLAFILVIVTLPVFLPISLIFRIYRGAIKDRILKDTQGQVALVDSDDAIWFQDTRENMAIINSLMLMKGKPDIEKWRKAVYERLVDIRDELGQKMFPKMACYSTKMYGRDVWVRVPDYNIKDNCILWEKSVPASRSELESLLGYMCSQPLPQKKALWQIILVPSGDQHQDLFYAVLRFHHSIGDGISLSKALMTKLVDAPEEEKILSRFGSKNKMNRILKGIFTGPAMLIERLAWPVQNHLLHGPKLSGDKVIAWSEQIDLAMIKRMKEATNCTVNDVLFACLSSAFHELFKRHSSGVPRDILAYVPVDIRRPTSKLVMDNQFALVFLPLPLDIEDPVECLEEIKRRMGVIKSSAEPLVNAVSITYCMSRLPNFITKRLFDGMSDKCSLVLSNVPGPQVKLYICGNAIEDMIFWPPQRGKVGMGISILSYNGHVKMGVSLDRCILSNPSILVTQFEEQVNKLAMVLNALEAS